MSGENDRKNSRILTIDDVESIHRDYRMILECDKPEASVFDQVDAELFGAADKTVEQETFQLDSAFQGQQALEMVQTAVQEGWPYALAFVDIRMPPGWDGIRTIKEIWQADRNIEVIICSAYSDYSWHDVIREIGQTDKLLVLKKPFDNIEVQQLASSLTLKWKINTRLSEMVRVRTSEMYYWVRELECLRCISVLIEQLDVPLEETLQSIVDCLPRGFRSPDIVCARVALDDQEYCTENFNSTMWKLCGDIPLTGKQPGALEVCYLEERTNKGDELFLKEEKDLIHQVCGQLGHLIEREEWACALKQENKRLEKLADESRSLQICDEPESSA